MSHNTAETAQNAQEPYTIFTPVQRLAIAVACAVSGIFSTLSSFIYFPAITALATSLNVSIQAINLTITSYQIVSGLAPSIFGDMADRMGRRPVIIITFTLYIAANIGLAVQSQYGALVALRCLQSAGASSTIALAYAVVADISTGADRGTYVGVLLGVTNSAPGLGPVLGGIVAQELSWRWIFWILAIVSGSHFMLLAIFLPETCRKIVGNGSILAPRLNRSLYSILRSQKNKHLTSPGALPSRFVIPNPFSCLITLIDRANITILLVGGAQYTIFVCMAASLSAQMIEIYNLSYLNAGLVYLPAGVGGLIAAFLSGKLLDYDYRVVSRKHQAHLDGENTKFPLEQARLRSVFPIIILSCAATVGYGWALKARTHISVPLIMQFFHGACQAAISVTVGTLLTDFNPGKTATVQASYSLVRCCLSAAGAAALEAMIKSIGIGWCFTVLGGFLGLGVPVFLLLKRMGPAWRAAKGKVIEMPEDMPSRSEKSA